MSDQLELFPVLPPHTYPWPALAKVTHCRSCGSEIVFTTTDRGLQVPLSVASQRKHDGQWVGTSHFRDCPQASGWGRKR